MGLTSPPTPAARHLRVLRLSLAAVWLGTALCSVAGLHGISRDLLRGLPALGDGPASALILTASAWDALLGLALLCWPRRGVLMLALATTAGLTLAAAVLTPDMLLHPFGPLLKNLPIAAALWVLWDTTP